MGRNRFFQSVLDTIIDSGSGVSGVSLIEICNGNRVLIESHKGIVSYGNNEVIVKVLNGNIRISGMCLHLVRMSREQLLITGQIKSVYFGEKS